MAYDGVTVAGLVHELNQTIVSARIAKIAQPEKDELLLTLKNNGVQYRLLLSASASLPYACLTDENKPGPLAAPTFCMVLRKHLSGGRITAVTQPSMERIIRFRIEHLNDMGDLCAKELIVELMGKHSNIIFCDEDGTIIDSIKHVSAAVSSLREVLPGRKYFVAQTQQDKTDPLSLTDTAQIETLLQRPVTVAKAIYGGLTGFSPMLAQELSYRAGCDGDMPLSALDASQKKRLAETILHFCREIRAGHFEPVIVYRGREPVEFAAVRLSMYEDQKVCPFASVSEVIRLFYGQREVFARIHQKSSELRRITQTALDRCRKKYALQQKQLSDTAKRDRYKLYGELISVYGHDLPEGAKYLEAENYYEENRIIRIPLDETLSPMENSQKYYDRYNKLKRTYEALVVQLEQTKRRIDHLESIQNSLEIALAAEDLVQIREELAEAGYMKRGTGRKKKQGRTKPLHYISTDGYDIYVGKNNYQNDELTFQTAAGNDWWFHAKGMPGSHVVVKSRGGELPDRVFEEAGRIAGYYSKGRDSEKLEIDYVQKKHVKKPAGAAPGFVVYYTNYSLTIRPDIEGIRLTED